MAESAKTAKEYLAEGIRYYFGNGVAKDPAKAVACYQKAADMGDAEGQWRLGNCYLNGLGVAKDEEIAVDYFRRAAALSYAPAMNSLGFCYDFGKGVEKDMTKAVAWYRKAADMGDGVAMRNLGLCYRDGDGVPKDDVKAQACFKRAVEMLTADAKKGIDRAQNSLGVCYEYGQGVAKDYAQAVAWYRKAAEQGNARAQYNLGGCYDHGYGVAKDSTQAKYWYGKAADQGHEAAKKEIARIVFSEFGDGSTSTNSIPKNSNASANNNTSAGIGTKQSGGAGEAATHTIDTFVINKKILSQYGSMTLGEKIKAKVTDGARRVFKPNSSEGHIIKGRKLCDKANDVLCKSKTLEAYKQAFEYLKKAYNEFVSSEDNELINLCALDHNTVLRYYRLRIEQKGDGLVQKGEGLRKANNYKEAEEAFKAAAECYQSISLEEKKKNAATKEKECHRLYVLQEAERAFADGERKYSARNYYEAERAFKKAASCYQELGMRDKESFANKKAVESHKAYMFETGKQYYIDAKSKMNDSYYYEAKKLFGEAYDCFADSGHKERLDDCNDMIGYCRDMEEKCEAAGNRLYNNGCTLIHNEEYESAIDRFEKAAYQYRCSGNESDRQDCHEKVKLCKEFIRADKAYSDGVDAYNGGRNSINCCSFINGRDPDYYWTAINCFRNARELYQKLGKTEKANKCNGDICDCYDELGMISYNEGQHMSYSLEAIKYYETAIEYFSEAGNESMIGKCDYCIKKCRDYF